MTCDINCYQLSTIISPLKPEKVRIRILYDTDVVFEHDLKSLLYTILINFVSLNLINFCVLKSNMTNSNLALMHVHYNL